MHPSTRQKLHSSAHVPFDIRPVAFVNGHDGKDTKLQVKTNDQPPQSHAITNDMLTITWNKPLELPLQPTTSHRSSFSLQWLRDNIYSDPLEVDRRRMVTSQHHTWTPADLTHVDLWSDYRKFILADNDNGNTPSEFRRVLDHLHRYGLAFLRNVPVEDHREVERVAERFGPIRDTLYGRSWDVRSVPDAKNIAYTSLFLDLHMDLM